MPSSNPNLCFSIGTIFLLILTQCVASSDTIRQACRTCADRSTALSYNFCISTLQTGPAGDLRGLAVSAMLQALDNATVTVSTIKNLIVKKDSDFDIYAQSCLKDCLELYSDGVDSVADAVRSFLQGQYGTVNARLSAAMDAAVTCEDGFGDRGLGEETSSSPLSRENYDLFQLSDVALCIVSMISPSMRS